jgi:hypothetical protein
VCAYITQKNYYLSAVASDAQKKERYSHIHTHARKIVLIFKFAVISHRNERRRRRQALKIFIIFISLIALALLSWLVAASSPNRLQLTLVLLISREIMRKRIHKNSIVYKII